ncbi:MAG: HAMP domain-containing sensor histidine kinase [Candidatus Saccharimonas sp.]
MAITKSHGPKDATPQIRDFWRRYRRTALAVTILMQLVATLIVGLSLLFGGAEPDGKVFWITMFASVITITALNYALVSFLLTPLRDISMAITSAAGEKPTESLANPNMPRYSRDGFGTMLQFIYKLSSSKKTNDAAEGSNDTLHALTTALDETTAGIVILDSQGVIQYANKAAPIITEADGTKKLELMFENDPSFDTWLANCRESAVHASQTWQRIPNRIVGEDDRRIFCVTANYEKGSAAEVVLVTYDASSIFQPDDDDLDFISFAAHELRGPITVIRGYLDVLKRELEEQIEPDQVELFERLIVSANRLSGYINNILNASRFDRRHLKVNLSEMSLSAIYDSVRDDMNLRASSQHRLLSVDIPTDLPTIAADKSSLSEVISNLIDNALKYSNEGGAVSVSAAVDGDSVKVSVVDNGIGIPASVIGNLFHKFYRSHRSRETVAGTGIGLYICKAIIESHGGKIGVSSVEGQGATFTFTVPTYASVADKLQANDHTNAGLISSSDGWIKNHSKFVG